MRKGIRVTFGVRRAGKEEGLRVSQDPFLKKEEVTTAKQV